MPKKIAIIGVGNIGFRHFQALERLEEPLCVQVVDVMPENLEKVRAEHSANGKNIVSLGTCASIDELENELDYAIVATSSGVRRAVTEELLNKKQVKNMLLEKVLFQKIEDYDAVGALIKEKGVNTYVSCCRRMNESYKNLKKMLYGRKFNVTVSGSAWGLGCNAIHIIDIIYDLASTNANLVCNADMLDDEIIPSKRSGYVEFTGTITGSIGDCVNFAITSLNKEPSPVILYIYAGDDIYVIKEAEQKIYHYITGTVIESPFEMPFLSAQGADIAKAILFDGDCTLPTYEVASKIHIAMLSAFLDKMGKIQKEQVKICPIT